LRIRERSLLLIYSSRSSNSSKYSRIRKVLKKNLIVRGLRMKEKGNGTTVFNILKKHVLIDMVYFLYLDVLVCSCEFCEWLNETIILYIIAKLQFCSLVFFLRRHFPEIPSDIQKMSSSKKLSSRISGRISDIRYYIYFDPIIYDSVHP